MGRMAPAYGIGGVMNTSLVHRGREYNLRQYYGEPQAAMDRGSDSQQTSSDQPSRRRIMDTYALTSSAQISEETPAGATSAALDGRILRRSKSGFEPAQAGYYPELAELVQKKAGLVADAEKSPEER